MIPNQKILMLEAWEKDVFDELSISEIMKISKKKSKPWVFNTLKLLTKEGLLTSKRKGNLDIYSMNMDNPFLFQALQYIESQNNLDFSRMGIISETINKVPIKNYCLMIFGSYANGKQRKNSDLDMCFLVENEQARKNIKPYFNDVKLNHSISVDDHYITFGDFIKMLLREEENIGKQIFRNRIIFYNADIYYQLIKEAHKNGFRA